MQVVLGIKNVLPAEENVFDILLGELQRVIPGVTWTAAGIVAHQNAVMDWALARGVPAIRTGLEDNIRVSKTRLAASNAELVSLAARRTVHACRPATPAEARAILGLA